MRVVVTGLLASFPMGGVTWDYLAYVRGFGLLGAEVLYLEDTGQWVYDPRQATFTDRVGGNVRYLERVLRSAEQRGLRWSFRGPDGTYFGASERMVSQFCSAADLLVNVSGCCWLRDAYRGARRMVYLDTDPGYSQAKLAAVQHGVGSKDDEYSVNLIMAHDRFFTFAESFGDESCLLPDCGLDWQTTRQPIVLADWPVSRRPDAPAYTTVMSWKTDVTLPVIGGVTYGGKDVEFMRFIELPQRTRAKLEVAASGRMPRAKLQESGWSVVDAAALSVTPKAYRNYLARSRGEWSVAKQAYVATRSGWFSCRSACYLALGKPVVAQDTGFSRLYPTGNGLFAFDTIDGAVAGLEAVEDDYSRHCEAARALAESEFSADKVLARLCTDAGL